MLYYADKERAVDTHSVLAGIVSALDESIADWERIGPRSLWKTHQRAVSASISLGELHQAVADTLCSDEDGVFRETDAFGQAGTAIGRCAFASYGLIRDPGRNVGGFSRSLLANTGFPQLIADARQAVLAISSLSLSPSLSVRIPEGYAFYSLYPEMYFASLRRLVCAMPSPPGYFVIGVRSIGTSLACLVAGSLLETGHDAWCDTVRPRGHPFDRFVSLSPALQARITERLAAVFVIVDEGPGLTCSSLLSACAALEDLGIPDDRIAILPAWGGAPSIYASDETRALWQRKKVFFTDAADAFDGWRDLLPFIDETSGPARTVEESSGTTTEWTIKDLSYGRWREVCYPSPEHWPVVHRPTERTKLLLSSRGGTKLLAKFVGLGEYGIGKHGRAAALADAGFGPPVAGHAYGFLLYRFLEGRPLEAADLSPEVMARLTAYYAFIARTFRVSPEPRFDRLAEVILFNSRSALDADGSGFVEGWREHTGEIDSLPMVKLDGRPFPHEWIAVPGPAGPTHIKTDSADHALDHTLVGEQSILWDLASACEEWEMDAEQMHLFLEEWERASGDRSSVRFLGFFRAAYLAFRTAALHYAIHSTNEEHIRDALQRQQFKTNERLRSVLQGSPE